MRHPSRAGFTLVELMVVIVTIAILMALAIPNLLSARISANESATVSALRSVSTSQALFQASRAADVDGDGTGEFGTLQEMAGTRAVRTTSDGTGDTPLGTAVLSRSFGTLNASGEVSRKGYLHRVFLPASAGGTATESDASGALVGTVDVDLSESVWCAYAWPESLWGTGQRTFFVNQRGDITATHGAYSGEAAIHVANAGAAIRGSVPGAITGDVATGTVASDGNVWVSVR